jgi:cytochrome c biogenesis protein ResB
MGLYAAQNRYFSAWITWFWFIPMPGGRLTLIIILINLSFFFFKKSIWKIKKLGIVILHLGGILLLVGGGLTAMFSSEGNMVIEESAQSNHVEDYHFMELAIINTSASSFDEFTIFDQPLLKRNQVLAYANLNFEIEIINYLENCEPTKRNSPAGIQHKGMLKKIMLNELKPEKEDNWNRPGMIYKISNSGTNADGMYGIFLGQPISQTVSVNNKDYTIILRRKRTYLPFSIELLDFKKILHPGTDIPKSYSSDINLIENGAVRKILIQMNEPLRHKGYTFFQSSFIEGPNSETTVLAVVKNYGRLFPYISSIIMCIGLLFHLSQKLPDLFRKSKEKIAV